MLNRMKKENGVTLAILAVTIVVMLILAGVLVTGTLGNNGTLKHAANTTNKVEEYKEHRGTELNTLINGLD